MQKRTTSNKKTRSTMACKAAKQEQADTVCMRESLLRITQIQQRRQKKQSILQAKDMLPEILGKAMKAAEDGSDYVRVFYACLQSDKHRQQVLHELVGLLNAPPYALTACVRYDFSSSYQLCILVKWA
jgi:hypothetical protein